MNVCGGPDGAAGKEIGRCGRRMRGAWTEILNAALEAERRLGLLEQQRIALSVVGQPARDPDARTPVVQRQVQRLDRHLAGLGQIGPPTLQQQRIADAQCTFGGPCCLVLPAREEPAGAQVVDAQAPEQGEKLVAGVAAQRADATETLEIALEPSFRGPCWFARKSLRERALAGPQCLDSGNGRVAIGGIEASGPFDDVLDRKVRPGLDVARHRNLAPDRRDVTDRLPGRDLLHERKAGGSKSDLLGEALGILGRSEAWDQRGAVAVLDAAGQTADANVVAAGAGAPRLGGSRCAGPLRPWAIAGLSALARLGRLRRAGRDHRTRLEVLLACADRAVLQQAVVSAEGRHYC